MILEQTATNQAMPRRAGRPKGSPNKIKTKPTMKQELAEMIKKNFEANINITDVRFTPFYGDVAGVQEKELPKLRIEALGFGGKALSLLMDFVLGKENGGQEAPASIRRLAALDILNIAGLTTTSQTIVKQTATNKPVSELDADELRALLASQKSALDQINQGLGRVVNDAEG